MVAPVRKTRIINVMGHKPKLHETFKRKNCLGQGLTSIVYKSDTISSSLKPSVVKVARPGELNLKKIKELFRKEANLLARLDHPHIVKVQGYGECVDPKTDEGNPPLPFLALELLEGKPLNYYVHNFLRFPVLRALKVTRDIASALKALHDKGLIHGDVKPENVMFDAKKDHVTLIDLSDPIEEKSISAASRIGTKSFMAPERRCGLGVDKTIDIYALGLTFYELLTAEKALPHIHEVKDPKELKYHYFDFLERLNKSNLPPMVKELISRTTRINKEERFQNTQDLMDAIDRVIDKLEKKEAAVSTAVA